MITTAAARVETLCQRLDNAVRLLARLYQAAVVNIADFDAREDGIALAKLTAANFCEIGAKSIYITEAGQNFIDAINSDK